MNVVLSGGLRRVAVHLGGQGDPGRRIDPEVDLAEAAARVGDRGPASPAASTPAIRRAGSRPMSVAVYPVEGTARHLGGQQVGVPRQPDRGIDGGPGLVALVVPLGGPRPLVEQVDLAGLEQPVDAPVVVAAPPDPEPGLGRRRGRRDR